MCTTTIETVEDEGPFVEEPTSFPDGSTPPARAWKRGPNQRARPEDRLTSPFGQHGDTELFCFRANTRKLTTKEAVTDAFLRMEQYCRARGADPQYRHASYYPEPSEEIVLYVLVRYDLSVWNRLENQAGRLGLHRERLTDTNEIPSPQVIAPLLARLLPSTQEDGEGKEGEEGI